MQIPSELWDSCQHFQYCLAASVKQLWIQTSALQALPLPVFADFTIVLYSEEAYELEELMK